MIPFMEISLRGLFPVGLRILEEESGILVDDLGERLLVGRGGVGIRGHAEPVGAVLLTASPVHGTDEEHLLPRGHGIELLLRLPEHGFEGIVMGGRLDLAVGCEEMRVYIPVRDEIVHGLDVRVRIAEDLVEVSRPCDVALQIADGIGDLLRRTGLVDGILEELLEESLTLAAPLGMGCPVLGYLLVVGDEGAAPFQELLCVHHRLGIGFGIVDDLLKVEPAPDGVVESLEGLSDLRDRPHFGDGLLPAAVGTSVPDEIIAVDETVLLRIDAAVVPSSGLIAGRIVGTALAVVGVSQGVDTSVGPVPPSSGIALSGHPGALGSAGTLHLVLGEEPIGVLSSELHKEIDVLHRRVRVGHAFVVVSGRLERGHPGEDAGDLRRRETLRVV